MYQAFTDNLEKMLSGVSPLLLFLLVIFVGLFVFWRGCISTRKNNSSIFDTFLISSFAGVIVGRISFIINNLSSFTSRIWYWLPYEKYGDQVYLFRLLPWRFFRVWDWGIDIFSMFIGFLIIASVWGTIVKKWKWSHIFTTIFFTVQVMLGLAFLILGGANTRNTWMVEGVVMLLIPLILLFLKNSTKVINKRKKFNKVSLILDIFFVLLSTLYIAYTYLVMNISYIEKGAVILFVFWSLLGTIFYISDSKKDNVTIEKVSSVREISPVEMNHPIKLPK